MTHIFKPGDRAYWLRHARWIYLIRNRNFPESGYSLEDQETHTYFTSEGKLAECNPPELLPLNPYDPTDPSMAYLQAFAMTQGWKCPICGMANNPNSAICINSWPMQYGTSVEWKHY